MKKAGLLALLLAPISAQAASIHYNFLFPVERTSENGTSGELRGSMFVDSTAGMVTSIVAEFTPYEPLGSGPIFSAEWSGLAPLIVNYDVLAPGLHNVYLENDILLSNGDSFHMTWEAVGPEGGNVFEYLHTSYEEYGPYHRADGERYFIGTFGGSMTFVSKTVPEPGTFALLGMGLGLAGFKLKRRNP